MSGHDDILVSAISRRLKAHHNNIAAHIVLGLLSVLAGAGLFVFLWKEYRADETELVSQMASTAATLVTTGVGGFFLTRVLTLRDEINAGEGLLHLYKDAAGPPPHKHLETVENKILDWL